MPLRKLSVVVAAFLVLVLAFARHVPSSAQASAYVVDMDGGLVLTSDGHVYARETSAIDGPVRWNLLTSVPADSPPVAITHLISAPSHYFLVVNEDGDVFRYEGMNRRVERTSNVFGKVGSASVKPKTIGGERVESLPSGGGR